jgi:hypothetical protein
VRIGASVAERARGEREHVPRGLTQTLHRSPQRFPVQAFSD